MPGTKEHTQEHNFSVSGSKQHIRPPAGWAGIRPPAGWGGGARAQGRPDSDMLTLP